MKHQLKLVPPPDPKAWDRVVASGLWPSTQVRDEPVSEVEVELCARWLAARGRPTKQVRRDRTNRWLRRTVVDKYLRSALDYHPGVNDGALIEAARRAGYQIERAGLDSPNAYFNLEVLSRDDADPPPKNSFRVHLLHRRHGDRALCATLSDEKMPVSFASLEALLAHFGYSDADAMWCAPGGRSLLLAWDEYAAACRRRGEDVAGLPPVDFRQ